MADIERQKKLYPFLEHCFSPAHVLVLQKNHQGSGEISWLLLFMYISTQILAWNYKSFQVSLYPLIKEFKVLDCVCNEHIQDACWKNEVFSPNSKIKYFSIFTDSQQSNKFEINEWAINRRIIKQSKTCVFKIWNIM